MTFHISSSQLNALVSHRAACVALIEHGHIAPTVDLTLEDFTNIVGVAEGIKTQEDLWNAVRALIAEGREKAQSEPMQIICIAKAYAMKADYDELADTENLGLKKMFDEGDPRVVEVVRTQLFTESNSTLCQQVVRTLPDGFEWDELVIMDTIEDNYVPDVTWAQLTEVS